MGLVNSTRQITQPRPAWLIDRIGKPKDININVSVVPTVASEGTSHPWYNSNDGSMRIPSGTSMAKITATGLYVPTKRATIVSGGGAGVATVVLDNVAPFKIGEEIGNANATQTISAINYSTKTVTVDTVWGTDLTTGGAVDVYTNDSAGEMTAAGLLVPEIVIGAGGEVTVQPHGSIVDVAIVDEDRIHSGVTLPAQSKTDLGNNIVYR